MVEEEGFFDGVAEKVDDFFMPDDYQLERDTGYQRKVLDRRVEGYLDAHFDEYISTYQIVTSIDLEGLDDRCEGIEVRVKDLKTFALDTDAKVSNLETRVDTIKGKAK
ncbi:MAG: hypothetical protein U9R21_04095 [Candidatus Thermoplasmatota archaeon]|nr:hypothetical protein [Candidatus Thermoplasmatota archaeon]